MSTYLINFFLMLDYFLFPSEELYCSWSGILSSQVMKDWMYCKVLLITEVSVHEV